MMELKQSITQLPSLAGGKAGTAFKSARCKSAGLTAAQAPGTCNGCRRAEGTQKHNKRRL